MAVSVRIEINIKGKSVKTVALVNSGYETDGNEIIIPAKLAEKFKLWPKLPEGTEVIPYETVSGVTKCYKIDEHSSIKVITPDKKTESVKSTVIISEEEKEVLISDHLGEDLNIEMLKLGKGIWRFSGEKIMRESEKEVRWE